MWEQTKAELDSLFAKNNKIMFERRRNGRWSHFGSHLEFLQSFAASQERIIRPVMNNFGKYVESMGHLHYIESAEELVDGYLLPVSRISLHILLNVHQDPGQAESHSITFKTDSTHAVCVYKKSGGYCAANRGLLTAWRYSVGRYDLHEITTDLVESLLKDFVIEAILAKPQQMPLKADNRSSFPAA